MCLWTSVSAAQQGLASVGWARVKGGEAQRALVAGPSCLSSLRHPSLGVPFRPGLCELGTSLTLSEPQSPVSSGHTKA